MIVIMLIDVLHIIETILLFTFGLCFCACGVVLTAGKTRRQRFMREPVGWIVQYWIGKVEHRGKVKNIEEPDIVVIESADGDMRRKCYEVNPIYKFNDRKNQKAEKRTGSGIPQA